MSTAADLAAALGHVPSAPEWQRVSEPPVPVEQWGKDHWSTFAYVEVRAVDHKGRLDHDHMRCSAALHPMLVQAKRRVSAGSSDGSRYPTRLKGGVDLSGHDDYSCLDDMLAAGLLAVAMPTHDGTCWRDAHGRVLPDLHEVDPGLLTGFAEATLMPHAVWSLTDEGAQVAARLRRHKATGGNFAGFTP